MTAEPRRKDMRGVATRAALIEQAETLFAERGVDGVSLREIGAAIGAGNTNVVLYHFGSKQALIEETIRHRLEDIDQRRADLLAAAETEAEGQAITLGRALEIVFRPFFEQTNRDGCRSYIAFLHSLQRANCLGYRAGVAPDYPATARATNVLRDRCGLPTHVFERRLQIVLGIVASTLRLIDLGVVVPDDGEGAFADALAMAEAALTAKPS